MEKEQVVIQGYKKVGPFVNKETGEKIEGYNIYFHPVYKVDEEGEFGFVPTKKYLDCVTKQKFIDEIVKNGLGVYELILKVDVFGSKPSVIIEGFKFVKPFTLNAS